MKVVIKNRKKIFKTEVIAENGKKYFVDVSKLKEAKDINCWLVIWNYFRNKITDLIKICRNSTKQKET